MKNLLLAAMLTAAPAAAQTAARVPASGPSVMPGLGASFEGVRPGAAVTLELQPREVVAIKHIQGSREMKK